MRHPALRSFVALTLGLSLPACSGGGGGGSGDGFQLIRVSVLEGAVWKVNQPITFTFNEDVDFSSVSLNTISIQTTTGAPATGTFLLASAREVVFQPACPTQDDLLDSGLTPGNVAYQIRVLGESSGAANTVRSSTGQPLEVTQVRNFTTPTSTEPQQAFLDTVQGPPVPRVRTQGTDDETTFLEVGSSNTVFFERDPLTQALELSVPNFVSPLNLYSDPDSRVAVVISFNQALDPGSTNISSDRMRLEYFDTSGDWLPLETRVTLVANCTLTGARVRLEPLGVLPQGTDFRAVVLAGIKDLTGDSSTSAEDAFAVVPTSELAFTSLAPEDSGSDEFPEEFEFGDSSELSFQDTEALFDSPQAVWGDGVLASAFQFEGTGGPGGEFDWVIGNGDSVVVDTDDGAIVEEDGITAQLFTDGVVHVRDMTIELGGSVRVQGSKPLVIVATGTVTIRGTLDLSGFDAPNIVLPNTSDVRSEGGAGGPGGGRGGFGNEVVTSSTARGSFGQGPGSIPNTGGQGGESGFSSGPKDTRRPGGGAGGRFARLTGAGLVAQSGTNGQSEATGAVTNEKPPLGGALSDGPFTNGDSTDDFAGSRAQGTPGNVTGLIRGELAGLWGGYGGGGGGNAVLSGQFPNPNWTPASDEKGAGGGGGGGGLHIRALGPIQFGLSGLIRCNGGRGGIGENTQGLDHVGGNGGSGSGGHVILETASFVDFTDGGTVGTNRDCITALGGPQITGATTTAGSVSFGGAGGAGVIQIHSPGSLRTPTTFGGDASIFVPTGLSTLDSIASPAALPLIPSFGSRSFARSEWISVGGADQKSSGIPALLQFVFQGLDTSGGADDGKIQTSGEEVAELTALLDEDLEGNPDVAVLSDRLSLALSGAALTPFSGATGGVQNDLFLRTPALLENFVLRLSVAAVEQGFTVSSASYDEGGAGAGDEVLTLTVAESGDQDLQDFINANTGLGTIHYQLIPRFFRVLTGDIENALPSDAYVRIRFQAAEADGLGAPDESNPLVDWTGDISQFNSLNPGELQFFRFEVEFELADGGGTVTTDTLPIELDFLKIPFLF
jgi:hypothetical protein